MSGVSVGFGITRLLLLLLMSAASAASFSAIATCAGLPSSPCNVTDSPVYNFTTPDRALLELLDADIDACQRLPPTVFSLYPDLAPNATYWQAHNALSFALTAIDGFWSFRQAALVFVPLLDNITSIFQEGLANPSQQTTLNAEWMAAVASANATANALLSGSYYPTISWLADYTVSVVNLTNQCSAGINNCTMTNGTLQYLAKANATLTKQLALCGANDTCVNETRMLLALNAAWTASNASVLAVCTPLIPFLTNITATGKSCDSVLGGLIADVTLIGFTYLSNLETVNMLTPIPWTMSPFMVKVHSQVALHFFLDAACALLHTIQILCQTFGS